MKYNLTKEKYICVKCKRKYEIETDTTVTFKCECGGKLEKVEEKKK
jgi:transcription initiation factor IIE alpha subunit